MTNISRWLFLAFAGSILVAERAHAVGQVCFERNSAVAIEGPDGWVADDAQAAKLHVCKIFYPKGFNFDNAPVFYYPTLFDTPAELKTDAEVDQWLDNDLKPFREKAPNLRVEKLPGLKSKTSKDFFIRRMLEGPKPNEFETFALLPYGNSLWMGVLSARTKENLVKYDAAFRKALTTVTPMARKTLYEFFSKQAKESLKTKVGKDYDATLGAAIGQALGQVMAECGKGEPAGKISIEAIANMNEDGTINEWMTRGESKVENCIRDRLKGAKGPPPPYGGFNVLIEMTVNLK